LTFVATTEMIFVDDEEKLVWKFMRAPNHLNALRAFEAAARHLSYVAAADELNVTPAAVGSLVRGLEAIVGVELFHRSPAGPARLVLTEAAMAVLPELQAGFDHLTVAFERLKASRGQITINLTIPPAFADKWLLPRVERLRPIILYTICASIPAAGSSTSLQREWMSAFVTVLVAGRALSLPSYCVTRFFRCVVQPCSKG
jgi:DNA-binding transcriptional LysR family regulator